MDTKTKNIISNIYAKKEGFNAVQSWFSKLKEQGLNPRYIVMDGEQSVIRAIKHTWPNATIQRCFLNDIINSIPSDQDFSIAERLVAIVAFLSL